MTLIEVKFSPSVKKEKEGKLYYRLSHNLNVRNIKTSYKLFSDEWDKYRSQILYSTIVNRRNSYLRFVNSQIKIDINRLNLIISQICEDENYTLDNVALAFENEPHKVLLFEFTKDVITRLIELGKIRTSETYISTLSSFRKFTKDNDVTINSLDKDFIQCYESYLKSNGASLNTISFYMRILRAIYNRAVDKGIVEQRFPFKHVYTGVEKTIKRALPLKEVRQISTLDLSSSPALYFARDLFIFSFYTRGMSFVDMAYLKRDNIKNGVLSYRRRKTGQFMHIKWETCMQDIVDRYSIKINSFLLPIIKNEEICDRTQYRNALVYNNNKLKEIGAMMSLTTPLTMYVARHSWASIAKSKNIPISVISEGMGHDSETTTQIYLASLDSSIIDKANNVIINLL